MSTFIPGLILCERFYTEAVRPILESDFPGLLHTACRIGPGSEVLGFDTEMSRDHDWGPRLDLFLTEEDYAQHGADLSEHLSRRLPRTFLGYSTHFGKMAGPNGQVSTFSQDNADQPIRHRVEVTTIPRFFRSYLYWSPDEVLLPADWLTFPSQRLATITRGAVYHDDLGLNTIRDRLAFYPRDIWFYTLAAGWRRIAQEEHLMPRAGSVGDELGSSLIGSRLVHDMMRLCFLMERQYAPYPKWFGTAFQRLECAREFTPVLSHAEIADTWQDREKHLSAAYELLAQKHNALQITDPLHTTVSPFFTRPFRVIWGDLFADAIRAQISDPVVSALPLIGSVDQWINSTDALYPDLRLKLKEAYR